MSNLKQWLPYEWLVGLRYTRAKRKNHFISFISFTSMIGIALGVWALIVVLSVMNGFQEELRDRILGVASHIEVTGMNNKLSDWPQVANTAMQPFESEDVTIQAAAPYIMAQGMLSHGPGVQGAIVRGVLPQEESGVSTISQHMKAGSMDALEAGEFNIVLGSDLAYLLGAHIGDKVVLMAPQGQFTPTGVVPRIKQFNVVGLFQMGMYEYDSGLALIHIKDAAKLYRMGDQVSGIRLKLDNLFNARTASQLLDTRFSGDYFVNNWTQKHANFFKAIQLEKRVMFIILALIVAVAAFNIVSTLVMAVTDKRADVAILRTFGASPISIMKIFMIQGALIGIIGTIIGAVLGVITALNIETVIPWIEQTLGVQFLAKDVYYISDLPSKIIWADVWTIIILSFVLSLLATLYPSYKASKINPAEALRYE